MFEFLGLGSGSAKKELGSAGSNIRQHRTRLARQHLPFLMSARHLADWGRLARYVCVASRIAA